MASLLEQYVRNVVTAAGGDLRRSRQGIITGQSHALGGFFPLSSGARLAVRSPANEAAIDPSNVVGMVLPKRGTIDLGPVDPTVLYSASLTESDNHWAGHLMVMDSGAAQGEARRVASSTQAGTTLTLSRAFDNTPGIGDEFHIVPQRIANATWCGHQASSVYHYAGQEISGFGLRGTLSEPVRVEFDATPASRGGLPNVVRHLHVQPIAGGKFQLRWTYSPRGQGDYPADFRVFDDGGTGTIDYDTPLTSSVSNEAYVSYAPPRDVFRFTTAAYAHGAQRKFAVVARNASADEQLGGGAVSGVVTAVVDGPPPLEEFQRVKGAQQVPLYDPSY